MTVVPGGLVTLEFALEGLGLTKQNTTDGQLSARDTDVAAYIAAATPHIENLCGPVIRSTVTRKFHGGKQAILLDASVSPDAVSSITVDGKAATDFILDADAGIIYLATTPGVLNVTVNVTVGFLTVPADLQLAARELVRHWWQQGKQGNRPSFGDEASSEPGTPMGFATPKRVVQLCQPYLLPGFA